MANTKNLSRDDRKRVKRAARKVYKGIWKGMTAAERREYIKLEKKTSLKAFVASKQKPKE
ncbi:MAG: hypothetical protein JXP34_11950 [Planctomycetes bacterium]|nr:hypothetical protein [Planctomycetota bacterium]